MLGGHLPLTSSFTEEGHLRLDLAQEQLLEPLAMLWKRGGHHTDKLWRIRATFLPETQDHGRRQQRQTPGT